MENLRGAINVHSNATVGKTSKLLTQAARQLDRERDETIRAIKGLIRVSRYRHDEARRQAGDRLEEAVRATGVGDAGRIACLRDHLRRAGAKRHPG